MPKYPAKKIRWRSVESSNVEAVGWDNLGSMFVLYKGAHPKMGGLYEYKGVSRQRAVYAAYAPSVGKYINATIKPRFTAVKIA